MRRTTFSGFVLTLLALPVLAQSPGGTAGMTVLSDWGSGFQAQITLQNNGPSAIDNWTLSFDLDRNITSLWDSDLASHVGSHYVLKAKPWNTRLEPGATLIFGFIASPGGSVPTPTLTLSGGGSSPTATPTTPPTATQTPTPAPTAIPTATSTQSPTPAVTATPTKTPSATATPVVSPTATAVPSGTPGASGVRISFSRPNSWTGGYTGQMDITNTGSTAIAGWQLEFSLADTITSLWNGVLSSTGGNYVVKNESWNGPIAPGGTVSIGFTASTTGSSGANPTNGKFNGQAFTFQLSTSPTPTSTPGNGGNGTGTVALNGVADGELQITVSPGSTAYALSSAGVSNPQFEAASNNPAVAAVSLSGNTLQLRALSTGRAGLRLKEKTSGNVRYLGVRVRTPGGALPTLPGYLAVGSVSEDSDADLTMWRNFGTGDQNTRVDIRYIYLNGGPINGWWDWQGGNGNRCRNYIRESRKLGFIPCFVYYNIPDAGESYYTDLQHIQDESYMAAYFDNLSRTLQIIKEEAGDDTVLMVLEPDFIGYMMQLSGKQPGEISAAVHGAYGNGVLNQGSDPAFPDTLPGLVQAVNYLISRKAPNVQFGWQFNLWASLQDGSGIPATGLMRITDSQGLTAGRERIRSEANKIADYYKAAGVLSHGAHFVSIDKYGLDGGFGGAWQNPAASTWFWNALHWNNYLLFTKGLYERCGVPVVLWQIPVGHVNSSQAANPYDPSGKFADLSNTYQKYEDSAPTFFYGDRFVVRDSSRLSYFGAADPEYPASVSVSGNTVTWSGHLDAAANAGVMAILFGDGVGESTHGRGNPPPDGWWWMVATQRYLQHPAPRP